MSEAVLRAETRVDVTLEQARAWFFSLKEHPERYQFATHEGFAFVQGDFGEVGARFRTRERFHFLKTELLFELTEIREHAFRFRVLRPGGSLRIWGTFGLEADGGAVRLSLEIGARTRAGQLLLRSPPVASAVGQQIEGEVENIKASMERVYSAGG
jgi:hypothetical protein